MGTQADTVSKLRNLLQHSSSLADDEIVVRAVSIITATPFERGKAMASVAAENYLARRDALEFAIRRCEDDDTPEGIVRRAEAYHQFLISEQ